MKRILRPTILFAILLSSGQAIAQIPVTDVCVITNQMQQIMHMVEQVKQMKAQLDEAKRMYDSLNGPRAMARLLNDPAARAYLPDEWREIYRTLELGRLGGVSGSIATIRRLAAVADRRPLTPDARKLLDKHADDAAVAQGVAEEGYRKASERFAQLQTFINQIDAAGDAKATADLQARIQAEQAMLQNEGIKLQLVGMLVHAERQLEAQRSRERFLETAGPSRIRLR